MKADKEAGEQAGKQTDEEANEEVDEADGERTGRCGERLKLGVRPLTNENTGST